MEPTVDRVLAEAALAKRYETEINERASTANIPALIDKVKQFAAAVGGDPGTIPEDLEQQLKGEFRIYDDEGNGTSYPFGLGTQLPIATLLAEMYTGMSEMAKIVNQPPLIALDTDGEPYLTIGE